MTLLLVDNGSVTRSSYRLAHAVFCHVQLDQFVHLLVCLETACCTAALSEARTTLPESSSWPLLAKTAHSHNLALASLKTAVSV